MLVLLVEDDEVVADAIVRKLSLHDFQVVHAGDVAVAELRIVKQHFHLVIVDIGLPGRDGLTLVRNLRKAGEKVPVLVLTAHHTIQEKLRAFELGADDFLMKPFDLAELLARCNALIRRAGGVMGGIFKGVRVQIDTHGHQLTIDNELVDITRNEWVILELLVGNIGRVVHKDRLMQAFSGGEGGDAANVVETHVSRLRAKLGDALNIRTVRGLGYRLDQIAE